MVIAEPNKERMMRGSAVDFGIVTEPKPPKLADLPQLPGALDEDGQQLPGNGSGKSAMLADSQIEEELKAKIFDPNPFVSQRALIEVFNLCDIDESGEIDNTELGVILKMCGLPVSSGVLDAVLADIDKDGSGYIDQDEFVEFFRQIKDVDNLQKVLEHETAKKSAMGMVSGFCMFLNVILIFALIVLSENSDDPILRIGLWILISTFGTALCYTVFLPIFIMKLRPREKLEMLMQWHQKRQEGKDLSLDRTKKGNDIDPEDRFQPPDGSSGSWRGRNPGLRALADTQVDIRRSSKSTEVQSEDGGLQKFEDDPNQIKPLYCPDHYQGYLDLQEREAVWKEMDKTADAAEMVEGGIYHHYRAMPSTHVSSFHNKAKLPPPVVSPWADNSRRWKKKLAR